MASCRVSSVESGGEYAPSLSLFAQAADGTKGVQDAILLKVLPPDCVLLCILCHTGVLLSRVLQGPPCSSPSNCDGCVTEPDRWAV